MNDIDKLIEDVSEAGQMLIQAYETGRGILVAKEKLTEAKATLRAEMERLQTHDCNGEITSLTAEVERWRDDANRLADEYEATLQEIGGVYWEDPYEKSPALIMHKNRTSK